MKKLINILVLLLIFIFPIFASGCSSTKFTPTTFTSVGAWWWDEDIDKTEYLKFAKKNHVTEIYYHATLLNDETAEFILRANKIGIKVYWLIGDYKWLSDPNALYSKISEYLLFQETHKNTTFAGIHLDIEPHQDSHFETNKLGLLTSLVSLATILSEKYTNITFDYDIPFWFDDVITIRYSNGELKSLPTYAHMINIANRVFIMSYRDSASEIFEVSSDEINYATSINKTVTLCVETSDVGNEVSFIEEGKKYLNTQLNALERDVPLGTCIAIHNIKSWKKLAK